MPNKVVDTNNLPMLRQQLRLMGSHIAEAGIIGKTADQKVSGSSLTMHDLAVIQHEGCDIPADITSAKGRRVRRWLAANGVYLKKTTTHVRIPARPFVDPVMDKAEAIAVKHLRAGITQLIASGAKNSAAYRVVWDRIGSDIRTQIQQEMVRIRKPKNHPLTIRLKGSSNPLIHHGQLKGSVVYRVTRMTGAS